jgi:hypothetical protein
LQAVAAGGIRGGTDVRGTHRTWLAAAACLLLAALAAPARAVEGYTYTAGLFGGLGGALDADDSDLDHGSFQLLGGMFTEPRTMLVARLGRLGFAADSRVSGLAGADLTYLTLAGEYRFQESLYDSGLFLGLGGYRLEGDDLTGDDREKTTFGLTFGVTGDFPLTRWLSLQLELSGHWADFEGDQVFGMGHGGVVVHW